MSSPPLIFVYLGNPLPSFARSSLAFAAKSHRGETILLTDVETVEVRKGDFRLVRIDEWYDSRGFGKFREQSTMNPSFRNGFWMHATERFFVLDQFMKREGLEAAFHAELDVMVFDLEGVAETLDSAGAGLFAVRDQPDRALASLMYINSPSVLSDFLHYLATQTNAQTEMAMLGSFIRDFPDKGFSLPCDRVFDDATEARWPTVDAKRVGLFDASAFGQWLFGLDPRNVKYVVRNKFRNQQTDYPIEQLKFSYSLLGRKLSVRKKRGQSFRLRTLHIHSKIISRLTFRAVFGLYLFLNRLPGRSIVLIRQGSLSSLLLSQALKGRAWTVFSSLPAFLLPPTFSLFQALERRSVLDLSLRQRARMETLAKRGGMSR